MKETTENFSLPPTLFLSQQVLAWLLVSTVTLGSLLGGSYLAYRGMNPPSTVFASGAVKPLPVIQSPSKPAAPAHAAPAALPAIAAAQPAQPVQAPKPASPVAPAPQPQPAQAPKPPQPAPPTAQPLPIPSDLFTTEAALKGQLVLQVGNIDSPNAEAFAKTFLAKGMPARLLATSTGQSFRVVVGPLTPAQLNTFKATLDAEGRPSFPRQF